MLAEEEDYTLINEIIEKLQKDINQYRKYINIVTSIGVFLTLMVMIYFDNVIGVLPKIDMDVSIFSFIVIICSIIVREHRDPELEDIKKLTYEILEEAQEKDWQVDSHVSK